MQRTITTTPDKNNQHNQASQPRVRPFRITWHGESYAVTNIADYHVAVENGVKMHIFTAADGAGNFELKFNDADMEWFLGV